MSRPEFLNCIMTVDMIRRIREDQRYYDEDPERYEREQQRKEEELCLELEQERDQIEEI